MDFHSILTFPIGGDASSDSWLLQAVDAFVRSGSNPVSECAAVIERIEVDVMGCDSSRCFYGSDSDYVSAYLNS